MQKQLIPIHRQSFPERVESQTTLRMPELAGGTPARIAARRIRLEREQSGSDALTLALEKATEYPRSPDVAFEIGKVYLLVTNGQAEARRWFNKALELDPSYATALRSLALLSHREGDDAGARRSALRAIVLDNKFKSDPSLGEILVQETNSQEIEKVRKPLRNGRFTVEEQIQIHLASAYWFLREESGNGFGNAISTLDKILKVDPEHKESLDILRGLAKALDSQPQERERILLKIIGYKPRDVGALEMLTQDALAAKKFDDMERYATQLHAAKKTHIDAVRWIAYLKVRAGENEEAKALLLPLKKQGHGGWKLHVWLGVIALAERNLVESQLRFEEAFARDRRHQFCATCLSVLDQLEEQNTFEIPESTMGELSDWANYNPELQDMIRYFFDAAEKAKAWFQLQDRWEQGLRTKQ